MNLAIASLIRSAVVRRPSALCSSFAMASMLYRVGFLLALSGSAFDMFKPKVPAYAAHDCLSTNLEISVPFKRFADDHSHQFAIVCDQNPRPPVMGCDNTRPGCLLAASASLHRANFHVTDEIGNKRNSRDNRQNCNRADYEISRSHSSSSHSSYGFRGHHATLVQRAPGEYTETAVFSRIRFEPRSKLRAPEIKLPEYLPISPLSRRCPLCHAKLNKACATASGGQLGVVQVIK